MYCNAIQYMVHLNGEWHPAKVICSWIYDMLSGWHCSPAVCPLYPSWPCGPKVRALPTKQLGHKAPYMGTNGEMHIQYVHVLNWLHQGSPYVGLKGTRTGRYRSLYLSKMLFFNWFKLIFGQNMTNIWNLYSPSYPEIWHWFDMALIFETFLRLSCLPYTVCFPFYDAWGP